MGLSRLKKSFSYALRGVSYAFEHEPNMRIHCAVGTVVVLGAFVFPLLAWERVVIIMVVGAVIVVELINSALEYCIDVLKPRLHPAVERSKDVMAGAVLLTVLIAVIVGIVIFGPHLLGVVQLRL